MKYYNVSLLLPVLNYDTLEKDNLDLTPRIFDDQIDTVAWERMLREMPQKYLELLVCISMGFTMEETCDILGYKSEAVFINNKHRMKLYCKRKKYLVSSYN